MADEAPITHAVFEPGKRGEWVVVAWVRHREHGALLLRLRSHRIMVPAVSASPIPPE